MPILSGHGAPDVDERIVNPAGLITRWGLWPLRVLWLVAPLAAGPGLATAAASFDDPGPLVAEVALWAAWFAGLVATLVPTALSLTVIRVLAPALPALAIVAAVLDGSWPVALVVTLGFGLVVTGACYLPIVGDRMVNGSAYGSERRMTLRPPAFALLGPTELAWVVVVAGAVIPVVLLAAGRYAIGGIAAVVGAVAVWLGGRVLHQLSRRWIVFVPAGFVIHDHVVPLESILLRRSIISSLGPAPAGATDDAGGTDDAEAGSVDLTGGAYGLALQVVLDEPVPFARRVGREVVTAEATRITFAPTLPGAILAEARIRAITIAAAG